MRVECAETCSSSYRFWGVTLTLAALCCSCADWGLPPLLLLGCAAASFAGSYWARKQIRAVALEDEQVEIWTEWGSQGSWPREQVSLERTCLPAWAYWPLSLAFSLGWGCLLLAAGVEELWFVCSWLLGSGICHWSLSTDTLWLQVPGQRFLFPAETMPGFGCLADPELRPEPTGYACWVDFERYPLVPTPDGGAVLPAAAFQDSPLLPLYPPLPFEPWGPAPGLPTDIGIELA